MSKVRIAVTDALGGPQVFDFYFEEDVDAESDEAATTAPLDEPDPDLQC